MPYQYILDSYFKQTVANPGNVHNGNNDGNNDTDGYRGRLETAICSRANDQEVPKPAMGPPCRILARALTSNNDAEGLPGSTDGPKVVTDISTSFPPGSLNTALQIRSLPKRVRAEVRSNSNQHYFQSHSSGSSAWMTPSSSGSGSAILPGNTPSSFALTPCPQLDTPNTAVSTPSSVSLVNKFSLSLGSPPTLDNRKRILDDSSLTSGLSQSFSPRSSYPIKRYHPDGVMKRLCSLEGTTSDENGLKLPTNCVMLQQGPPGFNIPLSKIRHKSVMSEKRAERLINLLKSRPEQEQTMSCHLIQPGQGCVRKGEFEKMNLTPEDVTVILPTIRPTNHEYVTRTLRCYFQGNDSLMTWPRIRVSVFSQKYNLRDQRHEEFQQVYFEGDAEGLTGAYFTIGPDQSPTASHFFDHMGDDGAATLRITPHTMGSTKNTYHKNHNCPRRFVICIYDSTTDANGQVQLTKCVKSIYTNFAAFDEDVSLTSPASSDIGLKKPGVKKAARRFKQTHREIEIARAPSQPPSMGQPSGLRIYLDGGELGTSVSLSQQDSGFFPTDEDLQRQAGTAAVNSSEGRTLPPQVYQAVIGSQPRSNKATSSLTLALASGRIGRSEAS